MKNIKKTIHFITITTMAIALVVTPVTMSQSSAEKNGTMVIIPLSDMPEKPVITK